MTNPATGSNQVHPNTAKASSSAKVDSYSQAQSLVSAASAMTRREFITCPDFFFATASHGMTTMDKPGQRDAHDRDVRGSTLNQVLDALDGDVGGENEERDRDEPQGAAFLGLVDLTAVDLSAEPDEHDSGGGDLDPGVEAEPDQSHRSGHQAGRDGDDALNDVVADGGLFQADRAAGDMAAHVGNGLAGDLLLVFGAGPERAEAVGWMLWCLQRQIRKFSYSQPAR